MRYLSVLLLMFSLNSWANYCRCEVFAIAPLASSSNLGPFPLGEFKTSYYGSLDAESQTACRAECQQVAMKDYDAKFLRELLDPIAQSLILDKRVGYNCTGLTDFKFPIRVRARIGDTSLGLAHQSMLFLHHKKNCF
ncbi:MAG: hypothetical protein K2P81_07595 [Bacteriovoracaceae bacterium]|nr:hypothetical protein [Bacteriovoracaceae bacterium]